MGNPRPFAPALARPATPPNHPKPSQEYALNSTGQRAAPTPQPNVDSSMHVGNVKAIPILNRDVPLSNYNLGMGLTPVKASELKRLAIGYPKREVADMLIEGFSKGFSLRCTAPPQPHREPKNLKSLQLNPEAAAAKIAKEVGLGRFGGPWPNPPFKDLVVTPVGLVEKKSKGQYRLIHHLSYPKNGDSINSSIDKQYTHVKYISFDSAIEMVQKAGPSAVLQKDDVISAFSLLPLSPQDFRFTGFKFQSSYYIEKMMPMGASISCATWDAFSALIHWRVMFEYNNGYDMPSGHKDTKIICGPTRDGTMPILSAGSTAAKAGVVFYCDDWLFCGPQATNECQKITAIFWKICAQLGVPLAPEKSVGPCTCIEFLGLTIDSVKGVVRVPEDKVEDALAKLNHILLSRKVTRGFLESIVGSLTFLARAIVPARAFITHMRVLAYSVPETHHHVRVTTNVKADAGYLKVFLRSFNGVSYFLQPKWINITEMGWHIHTTKDYVYIDSSSKHWQGKWPPDLASKVSCSSVRELLSVHLALLLGSQTWGNSKLLIPTSDQTTADAINQKVRCAQAYLLEFTRPLMLSALSFNVLLRSTMTENVFPHYTSQGRKEVSPIPAEAWELLMRKP